MKDEYLSEVTSQAEYITRARARLARAGLTRVDLGGTVYWKGGTGEETICLLHGANDHAGSWGWVAPALARKRRLIIPDLAGHGESEPRTGPIHMQFIVDRVSAILAAEGVSRVIVAGNSMGAWVAILHTLAHPEQVTRLVLESGGGLALPLGVPLVTSNRDEAVRILHAAHGPRAQIPEWTIDALITRSSDSPMLRLVTSELFAHLVDNRLSEIRIPTTIIWGENDGVVPRNYVERLHELIAGSELVVIADAAHIPHMQQPERIVECLLSTS
jgi:pimeloyl-ACP methyl ester carboxylesterase